MGSGTVLDLPFITDGSVDPYTGAQNWRDETSWVRPEPTALRPARVAESVRRPHPTAYARVTRCEAAAEARRAVAVTAVGVRALLLYVA